MPEKEFRLEQIFPVHIRDQIRMEEIWGALEEIRVRVGQPLEFITGTGSSYLTLSDGTGTWVRATEEGAAKKAYRITVRDVAELVNYSSSYSLYAYKEELKQGYLTLAGGHRVGMAGVAVTEGGQICGISPVTFLNIRVAHEKKGCAEGLLPYLKNAGNVCNTLFFSEPGAGKTTLLRDCIRMLSDGTASDMGLKVCVVDERSEIAACHIGVPQNDLGTRTDVLCGCTKPAGIRMLLRAMSPQVIALDELGGEEDFFAVEQAVYSGCRVLGTIHAGSMDELARKPYLKEWMKQGVFERYVGISREKDGGRRYQIYNAGMERLC